MKIKNLKINQKALSKLTACVLVGMLATTTLTGCGKKADCNVSGNHAHLYVNEQDFVRYIDKEYLTYQGYERQEEYIGIDSEDTELYKFMNKNKLLKIEDNLDAIATVEDSNHDYIEYRYSYIYLMPVAHYVNTEKSTEVYYSYIPTIHYSWTTDPERSSLTGEQRRCHYVYQGFNIAKDENGKYVLVASEYVDSISDLSGEYKYIKEKFYKVVDAEHGYNLDYEDGVEDDPDLIQDEEVTNNSALTR